MKLASLKSDSRDGELILVNRELTRAVAVPDIATTMQFALDHWESCAPRLEAAYQQLQDSTFDDSFPFDPAQVSAPLPRAYHWADASAYVTHVELVRKARGAEIPATFWNDPLMYMGASDAFIGPLDDVLIEDEAWGIDFESEVAVITDDVPAGVTSAQAKSHIKLIALVNDVSLRNLIPAELAKQFGFYQSKPWTSFTPVAVTPDELEDAWDGTKVKLPLTSTLNEVLIGSPNAGIDMTFDFGQLIAHAAKSRSLMAGTVVGSGTVANRGSPTGSSCLAELRCLETIANGKASTPFMSFGDRIQIEMKNYRGDSIFGQIDQTIVRYDPQSSPP